MKIDLKGALSERCPRNLAELEDSNKNLKMTSGYKSIGMLWYLAQRVQLDAKNAQCPNFCCGCFLFPVISKICIHFKNSIFNFKPFGNDIQFHIKRHFHDNASYLIPLMNPFNCSLPALSPMHYRVIQQNSNSNITFRNSRQTLANSRQEFHLYMLLPYEILYP